MSNCYFFLDAYIIVTLLMYRDNYWKSGEIYLWAALQLEF